MRLFGAEQAAAHEPAEQVRAAAARTIATWLALVRKAPPACRVTLGLYAALADEVFATLVELLAARHP